MPPRAVLLTPKASLLVALVAVVSGSCISLTEAERAEYWQTQVRSGHKQETPASVCPIHRLNTVESLVPELAGLPVQPHGFAELRYVKARLYRFPNSYWFVLSGSCLGPDSIVIRAVCPVCRSLERDWRRRHGWPIDERFPLSPDQGT